jgi:flagellar biosynthesis/type III secretory pathway protein FliH
MNDPDFTRSCYATDADLYKAKAEYYQAKVEKLEAESEGWKCLGQLNDILQTKVDELEQERNLAWDKGYNLGRNDAHQAIVSLQAKVAQLSAKVRYGSCRYEALKQEGE